jgi:hypothetical protein
VLMRRTPAQCIRFSTHVDDEQQSDAHDEVDSDELRRRERARKRHRTLGTTTGIGEITADVRRLSEGETVQELE